MVTVAVLGPVSVRRDGVALPLPAGKTTELLVRLALDAGELVRTERLIEDLWGGAAGRNTLQVKVSALRKALGDRGLVLGGAAGYTLAVDRGGVDALDVLRVASTVGSLGDAAEVERECAAALSLFGGGGELLSGAGDGAWVAPHRGRLAEARLRLTEEAFAARITLGEAGSLVGELESLVVAHPVRERFWGLLITALYRAGRQADALDAYRRVQRLLAGELGVQPGRELRELERQVLRQDRGLDPPVGNLPGVSASLVGRDADIAAVAGLLGMRRLVTVAGPAGVGKTRLAVEVARSLSPAWLVGLDGVAGGPLWPHVGEAFGVAGATEAVVVDRLRGGALLVVDNCEHLLDEVADLVSRVLRAAPAARVLATSQVPLGVDGEVVHTLEPLSLADSVALFAERAVQQRRSFVFDGDAVAAVCRSLDGLPLAIELASARVKVLSIAEIARRLDDRFALLADPTSRRPARRRTLRAAIGWSYDLLFPDDQRGLWALACFPGGAPLPAFTSVLGALDVPAAAAVDVVDRLVDRSLVRAAGADRYGLLDSVRAYAMERLLDAGLVDVAWGAQAAWVAEAADRAAVGARGAEQAVQVATVRRERANIDAALAWTAEHDPALGLRIATGFGWTWAVLGAGPDGARRIRDAAGDLPPAALLLTGFLEASGGDLDRATADISQGMADDSDVGRLYLAFVRSQQGRAADALALLAECRAGFRARGQDWEEGVSWLLEAWASIALGETDRGRAACDEALRLLAPIGDQWALSHAEALLGELAQAEQRFVDAAAHLRRAASATHALGFAAAEAHHLANLGRALQQSGDPSAAAQTLRRALDVARGTGDLRTAALAGVRLGWVLRALGEPAREPLESAHRWYRAAGRGDAALLAEYLLAALDADDGVAGADDRLVSVLASARQAGDGVVEVLTLETLARVRAATGRISDARDLLAAAETALPAVKHLVTAADRADRDHARANLDSLT
ncbi:BTAD domain-containing putative transcriptional regulator [Asanoa iriomotensis]|nr:BTAD domain-containing putative transcriptional regulator [Asanoa iriomotensis]